MNNEELKKKICDIIVPYVSAYGDDERIADALIAAGIGDVIEAEMAANRYEMLYSMQARDMALAERKAFTYAAEIEHLNNKLNEAERRAARAEMAFSKLVHEMYEHGIRPMCDEKFFVESRLKDAEKELAEEEE